MQNQPRLIRAQAVCALPLHCIVVASFSIGTLSKPGRRRQQGHGKTKDLIGRAIAQHVRFKTLYIS